MVKRAHKRYKKGGDVRDIETGPDQYIEPMKTVPPDPERFNKYNKQMVSDSSRPVSREAVEDVFSGPTPEQKTEKERQMMEDEDPQYADPWKDFTIFSNKGGKSRRRSRRNKRRRNRTRKNRNSRRHKRR